MSLHQFVISCPKPDFEEVREYIHIYQDIIDTVMHSFKIVSFADDTCNLCGKDHQISTFWKCEIPIDVRIKVPLVDLCFCFVIRQ